MLSKVRLWAPSSRKSKQPELNMSRTEARLRRSPSDSTDNTDSTRPGSDTSTPGSAGSVRSGRYRGPSRNSPPSSVSGEVNSSSLELPTCYEGEEHDDELHGLRNRSRSMGRFSSAALGRFGHSRYRDQDDDTQSMHSARSVGSRYSASSNVSRISRLSSHMPMRYGAGPEDWSEAGSAYGGEVLSESEAEDDEVLVLLKHSRPMKVGTSRDFHMVRVVRASLDQPFGVNFDANESRNGGPTTICVAEDYPYLSVRRRDRLVSLNGKQLRRPADITEVLRKALSITLVFQRRGSQFHGPLPRLEDCWVPMADVNRSLLSATRASVVNRKKGEFKLAMHRTSHKQKFGLRCEAVATQSGSQDMSILISEDMPHLALLRNDRLCSINGLEARSRSECVRVMHESLSISLIFRRHPSRLHELVHEIQEIGDEIAEIEEDGLIQPCGLGLCGVQCSDTNYVDMHRQAQGQAHSSTSYRGYPAVGQQPAGMRNPARPASHGAHDGRRPVAHQAEVFEYNARTPRQYSSSGQGRRSELNVRPPERARPRPAAQEKDILRA
mmetsp:Transcript_94116/g.186582  ORF Transcript_94116/g.186582 Transcript_94116/m.186582 type:complete len:554 (+) Transcript_94116:93-1754(+)